jgi:murein DD-endopeptidase MepM/ murein hydrolase activator NlpD
MAPRSAAGGGTASGTSCPSPIVAEIRHVFRWHMNFPHDLQPGNTFRAVVAVPRPQEVGEGAPGASDLTVLGAEIQARGHTTRAVRYRSPAGGRGGYFEPDGTPVGATRIPTPDGFRMTSRFNWGRFHPVRKEQRPHLGVDYALPYGETVRAVAPGTVSSVGRVAGLGLVVEVRHDARRSTRYAHLSSVEEGISAGRSVQEGDALGRAGATGIATAPHLHFELLLDGHQQDPFLQERRGASRRSGAPADLAAFADQRDRILHVLESGSPVDPAGARFATRSARPDGIPGAGVEAVLVRVAGSVSHPETERRGVARWPPSPAGDAPSASGFRPNGAGAEARATSPGDAPRRAPEPVCSLSGTVDPGTSEALLSPLTLASPGER